jgi:hypothetical protein
MSRYARGWWSWRGRSPADAERARREFPRTVARRVFDCELVSELIRCAAEDRGVEDRVQRGAPAQQFGIPHAEKSLRRHRRAPLYI